MELLSASGAVLLLRVVVIVAVADVVAASRGFWHLAADNCRSGRSNECARYPTIAILSAADVRAWVVGL